MMIKGAVRVVIFNSNIYSIGQVLIYARVYDIHMHGLKSFFSYITNRGALLIFRVTQ